jgi:hypothetical protein
MLVILKQSTLQFSLQVEVDEMTVGEANIVLKWYGQPGEGFHLTNSQGKRRSDDESVFADGLVLYYEVKMTFYYVAKMIKRALKQEITEGVIGLHCVGRYYRLVVCLHKTYKKREIVPCAMNKYPTYKRFYGFVLPILYTYDEMDEICLFQ